MNKQTPYQKFIVLTAPRSGSNYLSYLLHDHPQIMSIGEVYCPDTIWGQPGKTEINHNPFLKVFRDVFPVAFLKDVVFCKYPDNIKAVGFRFFYHHAEHYQSVLQHLLSLNDLKIIHLKRMNLLDALISLRLAAKTQIWSSSRQPKRKLTQVKISYDECSEYFEKISVSREKFLEQFTGFPILDVSYEKIVDSPREETKKVLRFLNVPQRNLNCSLKKQNLYAPREVIINFDKLKKQFNHTKWRHFFE